MSDTNARDLGLTPLARVVSTGVSGLSPEIMGLGPVEASEQALARDGMTIDDVDLVEINEAFAAQVLPSARELGVDPYGDKLNVHGGAIAVGHPFGMTGARITTTLLNGLRAKDKSIGWTTGRAGSGRWSTGSSSAGCSCHDPPSLAAAVTRPSSNPTSEAAARTRAVLDFPHRGRPDPGSPDRAAPRAPGVPPGPSSHPPGGVPTHATQPESAANPGWRRVRQQHDQAHPPSPRQRRRADHQLNLYNAESCRIEPWSR
jgi:hypothetical protein